MDKKTANKTVSRNKKAYHDYFVLETLEAGISLAGTEVKSVRAGTVNLKDCYCEIKNGEAIVRGMHISPYEKGNIFNKDPMRPKKLLLHKREIMRLFGKVKQDGLTLIPLSVYLKGNLVKVELGLCKGKKNYDKREALAQKSAARELEKNMKQKERY